MLDKPIFSNAQGDQSSLEIIDLKNTNDQETINITHEEFLFSAKFDREGYDLVISGADGRTVIIEEYFSTPTAFDLLTPEGAVLRGEIVTVLAGPDNRGVYAQQGDLPGATPIGQVETLEGTATVQRNDGTVEQLQVGTKVFQNDVVQTADGSKLSITFADKTIFTLSSSSRMVLSELVYAPEGDNNSSVFNLIEGSFVFIAGQVAKTGDMKVETPVATMGIRGTTVTVEIETDQNGQSTVSVSLNRDIDGTVGAIELINNLDGSVTQITATTSSWLITPANGVTTEIPRTTDDQASDAIIINEAFNAVRSLEAREAAGEQPVNLDASSEEVPTDNEEQQENDQSDQNDTDDEADEEDVGDQSNLGSGLTTASPTDVASNETNNIGTQISELGEEEFTQPLGDVDIDLELSGQSSEEDDDPLIIVDESDDPVQVSTPIILLPSLNANINEDTPVTLSGFNIGGGGAGALDVTLTAGSTIRLAPGSGVVIDAASSIESPPGSGEYDRLVFSGTPEQVNNALNGAIYTPSQNDDDGGTLQVSVTNSAGTVTSTLIVGITPINDAPTLEDGIINAVEDGPVTFDLSTIGSDVDTGEDGSTLTYTTPFIESEFFGSGVSITGSTLTFDPNGEFDDLADGETDSGSFTLRATDANGAFVDSTFTVNVTGSNDAPETNAATASGNEDAASIQIDLSATDVDGTVASFRILTLPSDGDLFSDAGLMNAISANDVVGATANAASVFFVPNPDFNGAPSFTFAAIDDSGLQDATPATATSTINAVNDAPETNAATASGNEDAASIQVDLSGTDADGTVASFRILTLPSDGDLFSDAGLMNTISADDIVNATANAASVFFVPDPNFNGAPTFTFAAIDDAGLEDATPATATITVNAQNDAPTLAAGTGSLTEDAAFANFFLSNVGDDVDLDDTGLTLNYAITAGPNEGSASIVAGGPPLGPRLVFDPNGDFDDLAIGESRDAVITITATDSQGAVSASNTVTFTVLGANDAPTLDAGTLSVTENAGAVTLDLSTLGDDADAENNGANLTYTLGSLVASEFFGDGVSIMGTTLSFDTNSNFESLAAGETTNVTFDVIATDAQGAAATNTITATVTGVNDAPETNAATASGNEDAASIQVDLSGSDVDGTVASFRILTLPSDGDLFSDAGLMNAISANDLVGATANAASVFFVPDPNFNGAPTFTFAAIDDAGLEDATPATATITVNAANDAPETNAATASGNEDAASIQVDLSGSDADGTVASFRILTLPSDGDLFSDAGLMNAISANDVVNATANATSVFFVPDPNFNGAPTFTFAAIDDAGLEDATPATATITVNAANDAPTLNPVTGSVSEDGPDLTINLDSFSNDPEGDSLTYSTPNIASEFFSNGLSISGSTLTFDPTGDFDFLADGVSTDRTFTLRATDPGGLFDESLVTLTITGVNDAPVISGDLSVTVNEGGLVTITAADIFGSDVDNAAGDLDFTTIVGSTVNGDLLVNGVVQTQFTLAQITAGQVQYQHDGSETTTDTVALALVDGAGGTDSATLNFAINAVNDAPVIDTGESVASVVVNNAPVDDLNADGPDGIPTFNTFENFGAANTNIPAISGFEAGDVVSFDITVGAQAGLRFILTDGTSDIAGFVPVSLSGTGTNQVVEYTVTGVGDTTLGYRVDNVGFGGNPGWTINASVQSGGLNVNEDSAATFADLSISDVDAGSSDPLEVSLSVANGALQFTDEIAAGVLTFSDAVGADGTLVFTGSQSQINIALESLQYTPATAFNGTDTLSITVNDQGSTGIDPGLSGDGISEEATASVSINVASVNDAPALDLDGNDSTTVTGADYQATFNEGFGVVAIADVDTLITDVDDTNIESATITLTNRPDGIVESLSVQGLLPTGITTTGYNASMGVLILTGSASLADYQDAIESISYNNTSDTPDTTDRIINVVVNDGDADSNIAVSTISVVATNDAPETVNAIASGDEDMATIQVTLAGSDVDGTVASFRIISLPSGGSLFLDAGTEMVVSANDLITATMNEASLFFSPNADNFNGTPTFTFASVDNNGLEDATPATATIIVNAVNDAPEVVFSTGDLGANIVTNGGFENTPDGAGSGGVTTVFNGDNTTIQGFTVASGNVDVVSDLSALGPVEGARFIDLNGSTPGSISQSLNTVVGEAYVVSFLLSGDPDDGETPTSGTGNGQADVDVTVDGNTQSFSFVNPAGATRANPGSVEHTFSFIATQSATVIEFASADLADANSGPFIDDVQVREVGTQVLEDTPTVLSGISVTDPDAIDLRPTISVDNGTLDFAPNVDPSIISNLTFLSGQGTSTLQFRGTIAEVNTLLAGFIEYTPNAEFSGVDEVDIFINDVGGSGSGGAMNDRSSLFLNVVPVNDAPVLDLDANDSSGATGAGYADTFTEGGGAVNIGDLGESDIAISDIDSATIESATFTLTNILDGTDEFLVADVGAIVAINVGFDVTAYNATTGVITVTGPGTTTEYEAVLENIRYNNISTTPTETDRIINVTVNDGTTDSNVAVATISVVAGNEAPFVSEIGQRIISPDMGAGDQFGSAIAVGADGTIIAGVANDDNNGLSAGGVFVGTTNATGGLDISGFNGSPGGAVGDMFGAGVAINDAGRVVVGRPGFNSAPFGEDPGVLDVGSIQIFDINAMGGLDFVSTLQAPVADAEAGDFLGLSVGINNNGVIVATANSDNQAGEGAGAVYVFTSASDTTPIKLLAPDALAGDNFGASSAINDAGVVVVGATQGQNDAGNVVNSGTAYVFTPTVVAGVITGYDAGVELFTNNAELNDFIGSAVDINNNGQIVVGAPLDGNGEGANAGAIYIFDSPTDTNPQLIIANESSQFGSSVSLNDNGLLAVGAPGNSVNADNSRSVYIYEDNGSGTFTLQQIVREPAGIDASNFGTSVALNNDGTLVVGADGEDNENGIDAGAVYTFIPNDTNGNYTLSTSGVPVVEGDAFVGTPVAVSGDVTVETSTVGTQNDPAIAALDNGGYVVVWTSNGQVNGLDVFGQRFDAQGNAVGSEFQINDTNAGDQSDVAVTTINGGFAVTFTDDSGGNEDIIFRRYNNNGVAQSSEVTVASSVAGVNDQFDSVLTELAGGRVAVAYTNGQGDDIQTSIFNAGNNIATGPGALIVNNTSISTSGFGGAITALSDGNYAIVWENQNGQIRYQRISANRTSVGSEVNISGSNGEASPSVIELANGNLLVTWLDSSGDDGNLQGIRGTIIQQNGTTVVADFTLNTTTAGDQSFSSVTALDDGGFFVIYESADADQSGIFGQRFNGVGIAIGDEIRINDVETGNQTTDRENGSEVVTQLDNGNIAVAFVNNGSDVLTRVFELPTATPTTETIDLTTFFTASDADAGETPAIDESSIVITAAAGNVIQSTTPFAVDGTQIIYDTSIFDFLNDGQSESFSVSFDIVSGPDTVSRVVEIQIDGVTDNSVNVVAGTNATESLQGSGATDDLLIANGINVNGVGDELEGFAGNDIFLGDEGNNLFRDGDGDDVFYTGGGDEALGRDFIIAREGNDRYVFSGTTSGVVAITYAQLGISLSHVIDAVANTGTTTRFLENGGVGPTVIDSDVYIDVQDVVNAGGLVLFGSSGGGDNFTINSTSTGNITLFGGDGIDNFDLEGGNISLDFGFEGNDISTAISVNDAPQGANVNLLTKAISNDGFGNVDTFMASSVAPTEILGTNNNDIFAGDLGDNSFVLRGGDDNVGGNAGFDTVRYNVDGYTAGIVADLNNTSGAVTSFFNGIATSDSLSSIEGIIGTDFADSITGTTGAERFEGQGAGDVLVGGGGADTLLGGDGNDAISVPDLDFVLVDGGSGLDGLEIVGGGQNLDFTGLGTDRINSLETLQLGNGDGSTEVTLDDQNVINFSETFNSFVNSLDDNPSGNGGNPLVQSTDVLVVAGDASDTLNLENSGTEAGASWQLDGNDIGFDVYNFSDATTTFASVAVDDDVVVNVV